MYITRLELKNFRNYESLEADFDEKINLILGNNAQGKTNLIESIYMTSIGRSFRTAKDSEVIMFGRDEALIKVNAKKKFSDTEVEIRIKGASKKSVKKDGIPLKKSSELLENIMIVIFSGKEKKIHRQGAVSDIAKVLRQSFKLQENPGSEKRLSERGKHRPVSPRPLGQSACRIRSRYHYGKKEIHRKHQRLQRKNSQRYYGRRRRP